MHRGGLLAIRRRPSDTSTLDCGGIVQVPSATYMSPAGTLWTLLLEVCAHCILQASLSLPKGTNSPSFRSLVVDGERMKPVRGTIFPCMGSVLWVPFTICCCRLGYRIHKKDIFCKYVTPNNLAKGHITDLSPLVAVNGFVWSWPPSNTWFLGPTRVSPEMAFWLVHPFFHSSPCDQHTDWYTTTLRHL